MVGLAEEIIDRMTGEFEPDKFEDRYEQAMIELIRSKLANPASLTQIKDDPDLQGLWQDARFQAAIPRK